ncbi:PP2C family protein-serine/threonine phosphatase [Paenibacillus abyssi]|uniref:PPM-type phosphatase domain-containing protein n=1 Tax=Paenibacillus abyssi TaxID=1340531 RepID=A0A917D087_9BACL|nr:SpoIIE family protein phosphatase [Paenibacillus abyssi]GGG05629.1 hypothetical protein GCM10010916_23330 [Paenibacillus abyssi]
MNIFRDIRLQLIGVYIVLAAVGSTGIFLSNKYVHASPDEHLMKVLTGLVIGFPVIILLLSVFTVIRLNNLQDRPGPGPASDVELRQWVRLTNFPRELLIFFIGSSMLVSQVYQFSVYGLPPWPESTAVRYWKSTLSNLSTFTAFGMIHYSAARWFLRSRIRRLRIYYQESSRFRSAAVNLILILSCGLGYMLIRMLWYTLNSGAAGREPQQAMLFIIGAVVFIITLIVITMTAFYLFRDLDWMTIRLREVAGMEREGLRSKVPVVSPYESGHLTAAFNTLQDRFEMEYARLDRELDLAFRVQEQLFAHHPQEWLGWKLDGSSGRPKGKEVGGGFCDVLPLTGSRFAITAGTVEGQGMPAALVMSALVMLLRTNIQGTSSAGGLLTELNRSLADIVQDNMHVHIALAIIDHEQRIMEYASAGRMHLRIVQPEACMEAAPGAEPLGSHPQQRYEGMNYPLHPEECRIALYSDNQSSITAHRSGGDRIGS